LNKATGKVFVVVESVYSMDGDMAPLQKLVNLKVNYDFELIVDEAHAVGVFGEKGEGLVSSLKLQQHVFACVYTFGKALGLHGAAIAGSELLKNYLINFSRSFIYTTALPPNAYEHITAAYQHLPFANRNLLFENIGYFKKQLLSFLKIDTIESKSPIQAIIIGDIQKAKIIASKLIQVGIYAKAIVSPTVPKGTERIRICIHSYNTKSEIDLLVNKIKLSL
jgi:8-amino-7-oxononanoate synthase